MTTASAVYGVATRLLSDVEAALTTMGNAVNVAAVYPAAIPWDTCECGTLAVAVQRQYVTSAFPAVAEDALPCQGGFIAADIVVQVLRCAPQPEGRSTSVSVEALQAAAALSITDAWVVISTVQCALSDLAANDIIVGYVLRPQIFAGPAGGCVGSALGLTISVEQYNLV